MTETHKFNIDSLVTQKLDADIAPLTPHMQFILDVIANHVGLNSPYGVGDVTLSFELDDLIHERSFKDLSPEEIFGNIEKLRRDGLVVVNTEVSVFDIVLTQKGWLSWSKWKMTYLKNIASSPAGSGWDWDTLLPTLRPRPLCSTVIKRLKQFRLDHPEG